MSAICVYCASGPVADEYVQLAADLGTELAQAGHTLVTGGGNISMMGAIARSARAAGGATVGVIPHALIDKEVADRDAGELVVTETMRERKRIMDERSDAFIALPGGIGTLEELFETWTGGYLGMHDKPVVVLDPDGFYAPLFTWLRELSTRGFVSPVALNRLSIVDSVHAAVSSATDR